MPSVETQPMRIGTPRFSGFELMERVNAMYQSRFIDKTTKACTTNLIMKGMKTGDYAELYGLVAEQCLRTMPENPFWAQMKEILSEEVKE